MAIELLTPFDIIITEAQDIRRARVELASRALQRRIAIAFEFEQYGGGNLKAPSAEWTLRKIRTGLDPRRGHATGALQRALTEQQLYRISRTTSTYTINFSATRYMQGPAAEYVGFYQRRFANLGLMFIRKQWLDEFARIVLGGTGQQGISQTTAQVALLEVQEGLTAQVLGQLLVTLREFRKRSKLPTVVTSPRRVA